MAPVSLRSEELDDQPVTWREADGAGPAPVLYVHGVPTSGADWEPFLARTGGIAPDLPGFGRSGKRADLPYTMDFYGDWIERFLAWREIERVRLVVHDWGAVGLLWAQRFPERVERLVIMNAVPLLPGYRWHRLARAWRTRVLGELLMGAATRWGTRLVTREANVTPGPLPRAMTDRISADFDLGTQRAILRLYRSAAPDRLAQAGAGLGALSCPALVLWGEQDPYIPARFADAYAACLPDARTRRIDGAGHWPWLDRAEIVDEVSTFLGGTSAP